MQYLVGTYCSLHWPGIGDLAHVCFSVCSLFVSAHLCMKVYKLSKERLASCSRRVDEYLKEVRLSRSSPTNHPSLPGTGPTGSRSRGSPCSPAPSPASITSTGSLVSSPLRRHSVTINCHSLPLLSLLMCALVFVLLLLLILRNHALLVQLVTVLRHVLLP